MIQKVRQYIQEARRHHLVRKTLTLQIGNAASTLVLAVSGVVLARLLQPELFGRYALAFSIASICSVFIGGGITDAITPALSRAWAQRDEVGFRSTVGFYFKFLSACATVTLVVLGLLPTITAYLYHSSTVGWYAIVVVIASIISTTVFAITQLTLQITGRFSKMAALSFTDIAIRYGSTLFLVFTGMGVWGAVSGHFVGALAMMTIASFLYVRLERQEPLIPRLRELARLARQASWQPLLKPTLWVLADSNFATLYGALPVAMVGLFVTGSQLAYFKLAFGYIILGMSAMGPVSTVMNVHFPTIQTTSPERLRKTFVQVTSAAVLLSTAITSVVLFLAPWVFRLLYGPAYAGAVEYVYGFAAFGAFYGLGVGLGPMWRSLNLVRVSIMINLVTLGLGVPLGLWLLHMYSIWGAVIMVTIWYTVSHAVSFVYLLGRLKKVESRK